MYAIEDTGLSDWFALRGGSNWASIEGPRGEWEQIAAGLEARKGVFFKRCAAAWDMAASVKMWSPRNAAGPSDYVELAAAEADALAKQIRQFLAAHPAPEPTAME